MSLPLGQARHSTHSHTLFFTPEKGLMQVIFVKALASILAWVSLPINHRLGATLGLIAWLAKTKLRTVAETNIALCFPNWTAEERQLAARNSLIETGKTLTEAAWIWKRPREQLESKIVAIDGEELLLNARRMGKGTLVATPHLGAWELCNLPLSRDRPVTYLYRSPRRTTLEPLLIEWRSNLNAQPARLDQPGIRNVLRTLKSGGTIGVLPDQEPDAENGVFAPLFNTPANTMTLLAKLAKRGQANVLFCFAERLPRGKGWHIRFIEPEEHIDSTDKQLATRALNRTVERCIQHCTTQYNWTYKRFQLQPNGIRRLYK